MDAWLYADVATLSAREVDALAPFVLGGVDQDSIRIMVDRCKDHDREQALLVAQARQLRLYP